MTKLPKLLIIDDDAHLRESLAEVLELDGFECHQAGAAKEGINAAQKLEPEIVIMDISCPTRRASRYVRSCASARRPSS